MRVCIDAYMFISLYIYVQIYECICMDVYACEWAHMLLCINIFRACIQCYIYIHIYIYVDIVAQDALTPYDQSASGTS